MNLSLEYRMYLCLISYPCRCLKKWQDGMFDMVTVKECQRCKLIKQYKEEVPILEPES